MTELSPVNVAAAAVHGAATKQVTEIVGRRHLELPQSVLDAAGVIAALEATRNSADPSPPSLPTDPKVVAKVLNDAATRMGIAVAVRSLAAKLVHPAQEQLHLTLKLASKDWVAVLVEEFDSLLDTMRSIAPRTPRTHDVSQVNASQVDTWANWAKSVQSLESLRADRITFGRLVDEPLSHKWGGDIAQVAMVAPPNGDRSKIGDDFRERVLLRQTMQITDASERWHALLDLERRGWLRLGLPGYQEMGRRLQLVEAWPHAFNLPDVNAFDQTLTNADRLWSEPFSMASYG